MPGSDECNLKLTVVSSWVMLHDQDGFVRLPNEQLLYKSPPRTAFSLQPFRSPSASDSISVSSSGGNIYLTNQRVGGLFFFSSIIGSLTQWAQGCLPSQPKNSRIPILLGPAHKCPRLSCLCSFLWAECLDGSCSTRLGWWYPPVTARRAAESHLQRGRGI